MVVVNGLENLQGTYENLSLALGTFDGIHKGHQFLIKEAVKKAKETGGKSMVLTFSEHPQKVFREVTKPILINTHKEKIHHLRQLGVDVVVFADFTEEFKNLSAYEFVLEILKTKLNAKYLYAGFNYTFGKGRLGTPELLVKLGKELEMEVHIIEPVKYNDSIINSTEIRSFIENGEIEKAKEFLGTDLIIIGEVEHGKKIGRTIGFPTANLKVFNKIYPPRGIYGVEVLIEGETNLRDGLLNIGFNPTIPNEFPKLTVEVFILDFNEDIYDKELLVKVKKYLRPEKKCNSLEELKELIHNDVSTWRRYLGENNSEFKHQIR